MGITHYIILINWSENYTNETLLFNLKILSIKYSMVIYFETNIIHVSNWGLAVHYLYSLKSNSSASPTNLLTPNIQYSN